MYPVTAVSSVNQRMR